MHNVLLLKASPKTFCLGQKKRRKLLFVLLKYRLRNVKSMYSPKKKNHERMELLDCFFSLSRMLETWDDDVDNVKKACTSLPAHYIKPSICMPSKYPKHNNNLFVSYCKTLFVKPSERVLKWSYHGPTNHFHNQYQRRQEKSKEEKIFATHFGTFFWQWNMDRGISHWVQYILCVGTLKLLGFSIHNLSWGYLQCFLESLPRKNIHISIREVFFLC